MPTILPKYARSSLFLHFNYRIAAQPLQHCSFPPRDHPGEGGGGLAHDSEHGASFHGNHAGEGNGISIAGWCFSVVEDWISRLVLPCPDCCWEHDADAIDMRRCWMEI